MDAASNVRKSVAIAAGSAILSNEPSSPRATWRSSGADQSSPIPRQSQLNTPSQAATAAARSVGVS